MKDQLISIITPVYNRPELLRKAIESALSQTYSRFEYIIIDDASTEDVKSVVESFKDSRIKYLRNSKNMMMAATYNRGIAEAKGDYVAFLESDDQWLPTKLEKQLEIFKKTKAGVVYCGRYLIDEKGAILSEDYPKYRGGIYKICLNHPLLAPTVIMIKKEIGDKIGWFDSSLPGWNDWDLIIRLSKIAEFEYVNELLVKYLIHPNQLTNEFHKDFQKSIDFYYMIYNKYREDYDKNPDIWGNILRIMGILAIKSGAMKRGRKFFKEAIKINPTDFKNYRIYMASLAGNKVFSLLLKFKLGIK